MKKYLSLNKATINCAPKKTAVGRAGTFHPLFKKKNGYALAAALLFTAAVSIAAVVLFAIVMRYVNGSIDYSALKAAVYRG